MKPLPTMAVLNSMARGMTPQSVFKQKLAKKTANLSRHQVATALVVVRFVLATSAKTSLPTRRFTRKRIVRTFRIRWRGNVVNQRISEGAIVAPNRQNVVVQLAMTTRLIVSFVRDRQSQIYLPVVVGLQSAQRAHWFVSKPATVGWTSIVQMDVASTRSVLIDRLC